MATLLVTGAGGFLAHYLAEEFRAAGWNVGGLGQREPAKRELFDAGFRKASLPTVELLPFLAETRPDLLVHTAGTSSIAFSVQHPAQDFHQNVTCFHHVLEQLRLAKLPTRVILFSSAAVYGQPVEFPITESTSLRPVSPYGFHKMQAEMVAQEFHQLYGLPVCSMRIFSAFGAGLKRQVIWELCRKARQTGELAIEGTGREERDFIHGCDVAHAARLIVEKGSFDGTPYNIACGVSQRIGDIAAAVGKIAGLAKPPRFEGRVRTGDPQVWRVEPARLNDLGFAPKIDFEAGLEETVRWCLNEAGQTAS